MERRSQLLRNLVNFFNIIWPADVNPGVHFLFRKKARQRKRGRANNEPFNTIQQAADWVNLQQIGIDRDTDEPFSTSYNYYAPLAIYQSKEGKRTDRNATLLKALFTEVDLPLNGAQTRETQYNSLAEVRAALLTILQPVNLLPNLIINSGHGLHLLWITAVPGEAKDFITLNKKLIKVLTHLGFKADPNLAISGAMQTRIPGTYNNKIDLPPALVDILYWSGKYYEIPELTSLVENIYVDIPGTELADNNIGIEVTADTVVDAKEYNLDKLRTHCAHVREFNRVGGNVSYKLWWALAGLFSKCKGGIEKFHELSAKNYPEYDKLRTTELLKGWESCGATLCKTIKEIEPEDRKFCSTCPHAQYIRENRSVIGCAYEPAAIPGSENIRLPANYRLTRQGTEFIRGQEVIRFLEYPAWVDEVFLQNGEVVLSLNYLQQGIRKNLTIPFKDTAEGTRGSKLFEILGSAGMSAGSQEEVYMVKSYLRNYKKHIENIVTLEERIESFGWTDNHDAFIWGSNILRKTEEKVNLEKVAVHSKYTVDLPEYKWNGSLQGWQELTAIISKKEHKMEAHTCAILLGLASPLLSILDMESFTVNLYGESGCGKSTALKWVQGLFRTPQFTQSASAINTGNYNMEMFARNKHLPITLDELWKVESKKNVGAVTQLVHTITHGVGRGRLNSDAQTKSTKEWQLILLGSSNRALHDIIQDSNQNSLEADPAIRRVIDIPVDTDNFITSHANDDHAPLGSRLRKLTKEHFGILGPTFITRCMQRGPDAVREAFTKFSKYIDKKLREEYSLKVTPQDRFLVNSLKLVCFVAYTAVGWKQITVDPAHLTEWFIRNVVKPNLESIVTSRATSLELVSQYYITHAKDFLTEAALALYEESLDSQQKSKYEQLEARVRGKITSNAVYIQKDGFKQYLFSKGLNYNTWLKSIPLKALLHKQKRIKFFSAQYSCIVFRADLVGIHREDQATTVKEVIRNV